MKTRCLLRIFGLIFMMAMGLPAVTEASPGATGPGKVQLPPPLDLKAYVEGDFVERRQDLRGHVYQGRKSEPPDEDGLPVQGPAEARALSELGAFNLAHGLAGEGLEALSLLELTPWPSQQLRHASLELGLGVLDPLKRPLTERAKALLDPKYAAWRDQALLLTLYHHRENNLAEAGRYVDLAAKRLYLYPEPVVQRALVPLMDVAVETGQWRTARRLARHFMEDPELSEAPPYLFLMGLTAERGGDAVTAFDYYLKAGTGRGLWAHRARMALVNLGLATGTLPKERARDMLAQVSRAWNGDRYGLEALQTLADLDLQLEQPEAALDTYASIITRYPDLPEAKMARQQARSLWSSFYQRGASGELSLSEQLAGHRKIAMSYRFEPGMADLTEALADRFRDAGATVLAADEYRDTHDFLMISRDLGLDDVPDRRLDLLRLKQAEMLMQGGQYDELEYLLAEGLQSGEPDLEDRFRVIEARLETERGATDEVVRINAAEPSVHLLRLRAAAYFGQGDWGNAKAVYAQVLDRMGNDIPEADAVRLLLSAHRSGDKPLALDLADRFPDLAADPNWTRVARGITQEVERPRILTEASAEERLESVGEALDYLRELESLKK